MKWPDPYPPRFRTQADAMLYMECLQKRTKFPVDKVIWPFRRDGDMIVLNPEYRDAPFERVLI